MRTPYDNRVSEKVAGAAFAPVVIFVAKLLGLDISTDLALGLSAALAPLGAYLVRDKRFEALAELLVALKPHGSDGSDGDAPEGPEPVKVPRPSKAKKRPKPMSTPKRKKAA